MITAKVLLSLEQFDEAIPDIRQWLKENYLPLHALVRMEDVLHILKAITADYLRFYPGGSFVEFFNSNKLKEAVFAADDLNRTILRELCLFRAWWLPAERPPVFACSLCNRSLPRERLFHHLDNSLVCEDCRVTCAGCGTPSTKPGDFHEGAGEFWCPVCYKAEFETATCHVCEKLFSKEFLVDAGDLYICEECHEQDIDLNEADRDAQENVSKE